MAQIKLTIKESNNHINWTLYDPLAYSKTMQKEKQKQPSAHMSQPDSQPPSKSTSYTIFKVKFMQYKCVYGCEMGRRERGWVVGISNRFVFIQWNAVNLARLHKCIHCDNGYGCGIMTQYYIILYISAVAALIVCRVQISAFLLMNSFYY